MIDILATNSGNANIMSMTQMISFVSQPLASALMYGHCIPKEGNTESLLHVAFTYTSSLAKSLTYGDPAIVNSEIRLYFVGIGSVFIKNDLSYGYLTPTQIPCKAEAGLIANTGKTIVCTVYPGSKPYIQVTNYNLVNANTPILILVPKLTTPSDDFSVVVRLLTSVNGVYNELANGAQTISLIADANIGTLS